MERQIVAAVMEVRATLGYSLREAHLFVMQDSKTWKERFSEAKAALTPGGYVSVEEQVRSLVGNHIPGDPAADAELIVKLRQILGM